MRRKPSRSNPATTRRFRPTGQTGKSSDAEAALSLLPNPLPEPMDEKTFRAWFKGYVTWLQELSRHFYDSIEGWIGPEGDPLHPPSKEPSGANFARVANTATSIRSELTSAAFQEAGPVARSSEAWEQLSLLQTAPVNSGETVKGLAARLDILAASLNLWEPEISKALYEIAGRVAQLERMRDHVFDLVARVLRSDVLPL